MCDDDVCVSVYRSWEKSAGFELLQAHGAGVCAEEQNEGHQRDIRDVFTCWSEQLTAPLHTLCAGQRHPGRVQVMLRRHKQLCSFLSIKKN